VAAHFGIPSFPACGETPLALEREGTGIAILEKRKFELNGTSGGNHAHLARVAYDSIDRLKEFLSAQCRRAQAFPAVIDDRYPPEAIFYRQPEKGAAWGMFDLGNQSAVKMHRVRAEKQVESLLVKEGKALLGATRRPALAAQLFEVLSQTKGTVGALTEKQNPYRRVIHWSPSGRPISASAVGLRSRSGPVHKKMGRQRLAVRLVQS
jgi:hypothetical protein